MIDVLQNHHRSIPQRFTNQKKQEAHELALTRLVIRHSLSSFLQKKFPDKFYNVLTKVSEQIGHC